jgi:hypothetical protein
VSSGRRAKALAAIRDTLALGGDTDLLPVSARTGLGVKELWSAIQLHLEASTR